MKVNLNVPFLSQKDNVLHPHGTCNTTCVAMGLAFFGLKTTGPYTQAEDNLTWWMQQEGLDRHVPEDLAVTAKEFGMGDDFSYATPWDSVKRHLLKNQCPVIVHGYFTPSGHIVILRGFDEAEGVWFVNDPNGDWPYREGKSGKNVRYSGEFLRRMCSPDGNLWAHLLRRAKK